MNWFLLAFISASLSATSTIFEKKTLFKMEALEFSFVLSVFNMLISLLFLFWIDFSQVTYASLFILYGKTILGALAFLCVMLAIKNMEISGALPLMVLTPGFVALFAFLLLSESLSSVEILGMSMLLVGTYILESGKSKNIFDPFKVFVKSKYHNYIIFALLLFTATSLLDKFLIRDHHMHPYTFMAFQQLFLAINFFIIMLFWKRNPVKVLIKEKRSTIGWILLISVLTIGYRFSQIEAIKLAPVALVLSVKRLSVLFATLIGGKLFKESNLLKKLAATIILIAGSILLLNW